MKMPREIYHPKAYLAKIRNIRRGLRARTKILNVLDKHVADAKSLAEETAMNYRVIIHHLRLLEVEGVLERKHGKPNVWSPTGFGQKSLVNMI